MFSAVQRFLTTLWVGSLWAIGYLAVPVLFAALDDRQLAGMLAGRMFTLVSFMGLGCGTLLFGLVAWGKGPLRRLRLGVLAAMLALVAVGEFAIQPLMADLKSQGLVEGSAAAARFAQLHGIAAVLYLITSLGGLFLVAAGPVKTRSGIRGA